MGINNLIRLMVLLVWAVVPMFGEVNLLQAQTIPNREFIPLWQSASNPGDDQNTPGIFVFPAKVEKSISTPHPAVLVIPGGCYQMIAIDQEGRAIAEWLNNHGVSAYVLRYRHGPAHLFPEPLLDARRAIQIIRANKQRWGLNPDQVGVIGFSAGGHLAALLGVETGNFSLPVVDVLEKESFRPNLMALIYPALMLGTAPEIDSCLKNLVGDRPSQVLREAMDLQRRVSALTPPTFLAHSSLDTVVKPRNSVEFYQQLLAYNVPAELHLYQSGAHGLGLAPLDAPFHQWTGSLLFWLRSYEWEIKSDTD